MSKPKAPAFQLYAGDFLTDTFGWTDEEVGVHCRLLFWSWANRAGIPTDLEGISRLARAAKRCWKTVGPKWVPGPDGTLVNERLEKTRLESDAFRAKQKTKSDLAVAARSAGPTGTPTDAPTGNPSKATPTDDPLEGEGEENSISGKERARTFAEFWSAYPLKKARAKAESAWAKLTAEEAALCKGAILAQIAANHFRGKDGQDYVPHGATWLNGRRWEDEIAQASEEKPAWNPRA